ncbi:MFS transporter [Aspergillus mulundensis]|uniref:Major facilitator superfamily (MFS) profile domain-containing protein n=1 Tax=Aspergillus mulundensis TaxID=1810919 RepID=A0A3D8T5L8_9EURO|nr:hypothetical protein DSM5745_01152 [Aspergillus mulundensis]RDW93830.1 hypothetical protein DSM5745_01152 [Aspergillus mulundensis]
MASEELPWHVRVRTSKRFIVGSVIIAVFTDTALYGLLTPVLPTVIHQRCAVAEQQIQFFTSLAVGMMGAGNMIGACLFGYLADHTRNRRNPFLLGLSIFIAATATIWAAHHIALMVIGRFSQGLASAAVWSVGLALLVDTVESEHVPSAMGWVNLGFCSGTVVGPMVGGFVYSYAGFDAVMGAAVGLLGVDVVLRILIIEKSDVDATSKLKDDSPDNERTNLLHQSRPDNHEVEYEDSNDSRQSESEFAYKTLLSSRKFLTSLGCALVQAMTMGAFEVTLPLHLQKVSDYAPSQTALAFVPLMVPAFFAPLVGTACEHLGNRIVAWTGYAVLGTMLVLLRLHTGDSTIQQVGLFVDLAFIGTAMTMIMTPVLADISVVVDALEEERPGRFGPRGAQAQGYGLFELFYSGGTLVGPLLAGWLRNDFSWGAMTLVLGLLNLSTTALILSGP